MYGFRSKPRRLVGALLTLTAMLAGCAAPAAPSATQSAAPTAAAKPTASPVAASPLAPAAAPSAAVAASPVAASSPAAAASPVAGASPVAQAPAVATKPAAASGPLTPVKVMWVAKVANMAPAWIALDSGYFKEQGLNVDLSYANGSPVGMAALLSGQIDILEAAGTAAVTATAAAKGDEAKAPELFIGTVNDAVFKLEVQPDITSLDQLKGKNLCISRAGTADEIALKLYLQKNNIDPAKDVNLVAGGSLDGCAASLVAGQMAGSMLSTPITATLEAKGFKPLVDFAKEHVKLQQLGVITTRPYARDHADTVLKFTRAYIQGIHRFKTDRAFAMQEMQKYLDLSDEAQLNDAWTTYKDVFEEVPLPSEEAVQNVIATVPEAAGLSPSQVIDPKFVQQLQQDGFIKSVYGQ